MPGPISTDILRNAMEFLRSEGLTEEQKVSFLDLLGLDPDNETREILKRVAEGELDPVQALELIVGNQTGGASHSGGNGGTGGGKRKNHRYEEYSLGSNSWGAGTGEHLGAHGMGRTSEGSMRRPSKAAKWDLNAIKVGQELSFIADTPMMSEEAEASGGLSLTAASDVAFLRHQPPPRPTLGSFAHQLGGSMSSISSEMTDLSTELLVDASYYKISHETLRGKLRAGERLTESMFDKVEECGKQRANQDAPRTSLFCVGGSGVVYKMRLIGNPEVVCAMKTVPLHLQEGELATFEQDVRLAYGHQHPNIMPLYDVCIKRMEGNSAVLWQLCIYMHYADCGSLGSLSSPADGRLPVPLIVGVAVQMLEALSFLHNTAHVCHRDLKPSNILLRSDGRVMLQDFGNSRQLGGTFHSMRTYIGTQVYMSPERINGVQYTTKSDVWALALILMECLVGRFPYECEGSGEDSMYGLLERIVDDQVPVHLLQQAGVHEMLGWFLSRLLLKDQSMRPSSEVLLCSRQEARMADRGQMEMCYHAGEGIGVVCCEGDVDARVQSSRLYSLPGAAQTAVKGGLLGLGVGLGREMSEELLGEGMVPAPPVTVI